MKLIITIAFLFFLASCASVPVWDSQKYHTEQEMMRVVEGMAWAAVKNTANQRIVLFDNPATIAPLDAFAVLDEHNVILEFWIFENDGFILAYANGEEQKI